MYNTSPDRNSFIKGCYKKRLESGEIDQSVYDSIIEMFNKCEEHEKQKYKQFDLEYDLRSNEMIINKCKQSKIYSQNLYAALCNNDFEFDGKEWSCSWRHAGGIIADILEKGDYIDWYCSGIEASNGNVEEGAITEEIKLDLEKIGWKVKNM